MKTLQFTTSINCGSCVRVVSPTLNQLVGEGNWQVDTENPAKVLTITQDNVSAEQVESALKQLGYSAESVLQHA
jgi:copper chaperone CopZ